MSTKNKTKTINSFYLDHQISVKKQWMPLLGAQSWIWTGDLKVTSFLLPTPQTNPLNHPLPLVGHLQISNWTYNKATDGLWIAKDEMLKCLVFSFWSSLALPF